MPELVRHQSIRSDGANPPLPTIVKTLTQHLQVEELPQQVVVRVTRRGLQPRQVKEEIGNHRSTLKIESLSLELTFQRVQMRYQVDVGPAGTCRNRSPEDPDGDPEKLPLAQHHDPARSRVVGDCSPTLPHAAPEEPKFPVADPVVDIRIEFQLVENSCLYPGTLRINMQSDMGSVNREHGLRHLSLKTCDVVLQVVIYDVVKRSHPVYYELQMQRLGSGAVPESGPGIPILRGDVLHRDLPGIDLATPLENIPPDLFLPLRDSDKCLLKIELRQHIHSQLIVECKTSNRIIELQE